MSTASNESHTSEKITATAVIEGSLTAVLDDDSSDDDDNSDDNLNDTDGQQQESSVDNRKVGSNVHLESDDDEELEVFTGNGDEVIKSDTASKIDKKCESSLANAMMASVNQLESLDTFGTPASDKKTIVSKSHSTEIKAQPITEGVYKNSATLVYSSGRRY